MPISLSSIVGEKGVETDSLEGEGSKYDDSYREGGEIDSRLLS